MEQSTQWGVSLPNTFPMKTHLKSRSNVLNIPRRHEPVATDTVFSNTPAVHSGVKKAQVLVARETLVADAYPIRYYMGPVNSPESAEFMGPETMDIQPGDWLLVFSFL